MSAIDDIIKKIALANHDGDVKGIALVFINAAGNPEIEMSFNTGFAFAMNTGIDLLKGGVLNSIMAKGQIPPRDRE